MPAAQGYYVSVQHKILGSFATKLLSYITVWNVLWILKTWVTVIYKNNLQVMLQYLIFAAQIDKLHYSFPFLVGHETVQYR